MTYTLTTEIGPNHDFPRGTQQRDINTSVCTHPHMPTIEGIAAYFKTWRDRIGLGGGNLKRANIMRGNVLVGTISYNGRFWSKSDLARKKV